MVTKKAYVLFYKRRNCPSISIYHEPQDLVKAKNPLLYKVPLPEIQAHHQYGPHGAGGAGGNNDAYAAAGMDQSGAAANNNNMAAGPAQAWMDNNNQNDVPQGMMGGPQPGMPEYGAGADADGAGAGVAGIDNIMNGMWEDNPALAGLG